MAASAWAKRRRTDAAAPPTMAMAPVAKVAPAEPQGQLQPPVAAATLRWLVTLLAAHEPDLKDVLLGLCKPRYVAAHKREPAWDVRGRGPEGDY